MSSDTSPSRSTTGPSPAPDHAGPAVAAEPFATGAAPNLWWVRLVLGVVAVVVGVLVLAWPDATVTVVAVLFGVNLLVDGVMRVLQAVLAPAGGVTARVMYGLLGIVSIVIGVLCLRNLLQTVAVLVLLVGLSWLIAGIVELIVALSSGPPSRWTARTALELGAGVVAVLAGILVLAYPGVTVGTLVVLLGLSLLVYGVVSVLGALRSRSAR